MSREAGDADLLGRLLREVSRSFYTTLAFLPAAIRPQISVAYLLARASDTLVDAGAASVGDRRRALDRLRERVAGRTTAPLDYRALQEGAGTAAERALLGRVEEALSVLDSTPECDRKEIREVLGIIFSGQLLDLDRFGTAAGDDPRALADAAALDDYTYRVAGCVGTFWTTLCRTHVFPGVRLEDRAFDDNAVRFGKGLQLVNILRDLPRDLRLGRCYLPADELQALSLSPRALLDATNESRLRPLYNRWAGVARDHLQAGWQYTNAIPGKQFRLRLACAWPILFGVQTLQRLRVGRVLDPAQRIRISRVDVRSIMVRSVVFYPFRHAWKRQFKSIGD